MTRESLRATARRYRREGRTITQIGLELDVARSTVGDWVTGIPITRDCMLCGDTFDPTTGGQLFCCRGHQRSWRAVFGSARSAARG